MKNNFIKSTLLLIFGGFVTKIFSIFIKIVLTRELKTEGISLYMMIMPTFNLFIVLSQNGFNVAISKLIAENKKDNKKLILSSIYLSFFITFFLMIFLIFLANPITKSLHNNKLYYPIISISFTLPFISLSSIIRSYFFGKERIMPHIISNILEQLLRIIMYIYFLPFFSKFNIIISICFVVLSNIISELFSILILYFFLPKKIYFNDYKPDFNLIKDILNISIPTTGSKLIGTIFYFFEPIIITTFLLKNNYSLNQITFEYGILTGYIFPLLLMPSFFSMAISQSTLPIISKANTNNNKIYIKKKINQSLFFSLIIGIFFTLILIIFPKKLLKLIYNTNLGLNYLKVCAPFFIIYYFQSPINSILQALDKSKYMFVTTFIGSILKILILIFLAYLKFGIYSLIISTLFNIYFVTIINYLKIKKELNPS